MNILNNEGRFDAHAKNIIDEDIVLFDAAIGKLETICNKYDEIMGDLGHIYREQGNM